MKIETDEEHAAALAEIDRLWDSVSTGADARFNELVDAVDAYERVRWPMPDEATAGLTGGF